MDRSGRILSIFAGMSGKRRMPLSIDILTKPQCALCKILHNGRLEYVELLGLCGGTPGEWGFIIDKCYYWENEIRMVFFNKENLVEKDIKKLLAKRQRAILISFFPNYKVGITQFKKKFFRKQQ